MIATTSKRLARFYEGFVAALGDVCPDWKYIKPRERKIVFEKVRDEAKAVIVDQKDGLPLSTFNGYLRKVKRALIFGVPLAIAERATNQQLQHAQYHVREEMAGEKGTHEEKMIRAYEWVKEQEVQIRERLRRATQRSEDC